jgi:apolipoprotein N-acyltransferase
MSDRAAPHPNPPFFLKTSGWSGRFVSFALGGLSVLGQAPLHFWPLALIGFGLLFMRLQWASTSARPGWAGFGAAFWFGIGYFGIGTFWISEAFIARGPAFIPAIIPLVFGLAALLSCIWGLAGLAVGKGRFKPGWAQLAFVGFFILAEYVRGHLFGGFPWNMPGYIFPAGGAFSQGAALWTIYGQSLFVLALSAALATAVFSSRKIAPALIFVVGLSGLYGLGSLRLSSAEVTFQDDVTLRIVSVPFNQSERFDDQRSNQIVEAFIAESLRDDIKNLDQTRLSEVTHIIWPEGAINGLAIENGPFLNYMGESLAMRLDGDLPVWILNSLRREVNPNSTPSRPIDDFYNSSVAITFDAQGNPSFAGYNDKKRLVPFGEFIPLGKWMESRNVPVISSTLMSISPAREKTLTQYPGLPLGSPQICYEIIFPGLTPRSGNDAEAKFILNQSNDAWFGQSWGPKQHANIARYRAIEEGLPIVRAASNGVSAVIDPYGRIVAQTDQNKSSHIDTALPKPLKFQLSSKGVIWLIFLIIIAISLLCGLYGRSRDRTAII